MRTSTALRRLPLGAAAVAAVLTAAVAVVPGLRFAYENLTLHVALETGEGMIALLLAYLAVGRVRVTGQLADVVLAWSFAAFGATNLFVAGSLVAGQDERSVGFPTWLAVGLRLAAAAAFCVAALIPQRPARSTRVVPWAIGGSLAVVALAVVVAAAADASLAQVIDPDLSPESSQRPVISGHALVVALQVLSVLLYGVAAVAFARKAERGGDELLYWLAAGAAVSTFARVSYVLFPSLYSNWVYTGDALRLAAYLVYLVGAGREITEYFRSRAEVAVLRERRRLARELHDGLTQELSFMRSQLSSLAVGRGRPEMITHVAAAAERALQESRRAIDALREPELGLAETVERAAADIAGRSSAALSVEVDPAVSLPDAAADAVERIVREAVTNAVLHGAPSRVTVRLDHLDRSRRRARLRVHDDGVGFTVDGGRSGFGLVSMRERAEELGGRFSVRSLPGNGTTVEVELPAG